MKKMTTYSTKNKFPSKAYLWLTSFSHSCLPKASTPFSQLRTQQCSVEILVSPILRRSSHVSAHCCHLILSVFLIGAFLVYSVKCCRACLWGHVWSLGVTSPGWSLACCSHSVLVLSCARDNSSSCTCWVGLTYALKIIQVARYWCEKRFSPAREKKSYCSWSFSAVM